MGREWLIFNYNLGPAGCFSSFWAHFFFLGGRAHHSKVQDPQMKELHQRCCFGVLFLVGVGRCLVPRLNLFWFQSDTIDADVGKGGKCFGTKNTDNERDNEVAVKSTYPTWSTQRSNGARSASFSFAASATTPETAFTVPKTELKESSTPPFQIQLWHQGTSLVRSKKPYRYRYLGKHFFANFLVVWIFGTVSN